LSQLSSHIPKQLFEGDLCSQDKRDKILGNIRAMLTARSGVGDTSIFYPINLLLTALFLQTSVTFLNGMPSLKNYLKSSMNRIQDISLFWWMLLKTLDNRRNSL